ncbi:hypothetical protein LCGC14_0706010 [marine sediment metagenome]|uniref:RNase III domain-containing protein n=1 Tax=marine sediment metagenome TaxID=412755 RepID=A0A0F9QGG0_9ZZZZ|nr:hypothetical protein [bacterium]
MKEEEKLTEFQKLIDYKFNNEALLAQALYTAKYGNFNNQRKHCKEFSTIGDIVLKLILALKEYDDGIRTPEGITVSKQMLESNETFKKIALTEFSLDKYVTSMNDEDLVESIILADIFEAIAGAMFLDSNRDYLTVQEKIVNKFYDKYKSEFYK